MRTWPAEVNMTLVWLIRGVQLVALSREMLVIPPEPEASIPLGHYMAGLSPSFITLQVIVNALRVCATNQPEC